MNKKNNVGRIVFIIIIVYCLLGFILPMVCKHIIFGSESFSNLTDNEWISFIGSYVSGILGGLGTLISVFITIKESRYIQAQNKEETDRAILENKKEREKELNEERILQLKKEKREFSDDIAIYVGKYITHISKYYYATISYEVVEEDYEREKKKLEEVEGKIANLNTMIDSTKSDSDDFIKLQNKKIKLDNERNSIQRGYNEKLNDKEKNKEEGNRLEANECYFILKTKLYNISEADDFLKQLDVLHTDMFKNLSVESVQKKWLETNSNLLIEKYHKFKNEYTA